MARPQPAALETLAPITAQQDGFFTTAQARSLGVDNARLVRLVANGFLERVMHRVYRVAIGAPTNPRVREDLYIKYLALDDQRMPWVHDDAPRVIASHASAADLLGIGNLPADEPTFTSSERVRTTIGARIHVADLRPEEWRWMELGRMPVTTAARTIVDLAAARVGRDYIERMIDDALRLRIATASEIDAVVAHRRRPSLAWTAAWAYETEDRQWISGRPSGQPSSRARVEGA